MSNTETAHAVVVDCDDAPITEETQAILADLHTAVLSKDGDQIKTKMAELDAALGDRPPREERVPLDDDALASRQVVQAEILDHHKQTTQQRIRIALAASDHEVLKHLEAGEAVPKPLAAHRKKLRDLAAAAAAAGTHEELAAIEIPEPPA
jgi:hypothetical protein